MAAKPRRWFIPLIILALAIISVGYLELAGGAGLPDRFVWNYYGARAKIVGNLSFGGAGRLTHANFDQIRTGMSLAQVERLLGRGERLTDVVQGTKTMTLYRWENKGGRVDVLLVGAKVYSKSQIGLR